MRIVRKTAGLYFPAVFLFASCLAQAQTALVIPQVVDGGAWLTTIALTNTSANQTIVSLSFFQETGGGATKPWSLGFAEMVQPQALALPGGSTLFLHTLGNAPATTIGWGQVVETDASVPVLAYAIFTQRVTGQPDQFGTAPAAPAGTRILVPFDNINGNTAMAIANPGSTNESISVGIRTPVSTTQPAAISLAPQGHTSFRLMDQFPVTLGTTGLAEFYSPSGSFAILALQFNGGFSTAPVYSVTGPPILASTSTAGGGSNGNIILAGFTAGKINTSSGSLPPTTGTTMDQVAGDFASYSPAEWQTANPASTFGPCSVLDTTYPLGGTAPYAPDLYLDAGNIALSGPGLAPGTALSKTASVGGGPFYYYTPPSGSTLAYGGTYTISSSGGTQVGPFNISGTIPNNFSVTNYDAITAVSRANDLLVTWAGSGFSTVILNVTGSTQTSTTTHGVGVTCAVAASLGAFSIPQGALAMLPAVAVSTGAQAGQLVVTAAPGDPSMAANTSQALTPSLVGGGQVNYGHFGPTLTVVKSLAIQ